MLKKLKLSTHLFIILAFVELVALIMGNLSLQVTYRLEHRITSLDGIHLPLIFAVSEASRLQMNQAMRMNEILLYAQIDDRQNFEIANDGYIHAGKQLNDVVIEAKHIIQKSLEVPDSDSEKNQLEKVRLVLGDLEKIHGSYEHLCGSIIRNQFKFRFLTKAGIITGNATQTMEQAEREYQQLLSKNTSELDDETKRLEAKIKEAFYVTKDMVRDLSEQTAKEHKTAFSLFILTMVIMTVGGLFLVFTIFHINNTRSRELSNTIKKLALPFRENAASLLRIIQDLDHALSQLFTNNSKLMDTVGQSELSLTKLESLAASSARSTSETKVLVNENARKLDDSDRSIAVFAEVSSRSMAAGNQIQKGALNLGQFALQMHLLATSASAEASRSDASRGFVVFTEELKNMAQKVMLSAEEIAQTAQATVLDIQSGRDGVEGARRTFQDMANTAERLKIEAENIMAASHYQTELVGSVQRDTVRLREGFSFYNKTLEESAEACRMFRVQTDAISDLLKKMTVVFDERRQRVELKIEGQDSPLLVPDLIPETNIPRKPFDGGDLKVEGGILKMNNNPQEKN
ncbi:MAG: methyl-accepting chemotaxis sensory transducer with Cache sensor [Magnetococcales bacterium]|nr:methyl-accepting chemotaxis sensory transducer with Cache sensor [Magnetococcales bacterium]